MSANIGALVDILVGAVGGGALGSIYTSILIKRPPKPKPDPQPICLCGHAISFHEDKIGRCTNIDHKKLTSSVAALDSNGKAIHEEDEDGFKVAVMNTSESLFPKPCGCLHYIGPEPIPNVIAM